MHPRMIRTIFRKDLFDAIRDLRVLLAILMPLGIGVFYNLIFASLDRRPSATIAIYSAAPTVLPETLRSLLGEVIDLRFVQAEDEAEVRQQVEDKEVSLGLIVPTGFDAALSGGAHPTLTVVQRDRSFDTNIGASIITRSLDRVVQQQAGQQPPAVIHYDLIPSGEPPVFERLGLTKYFVLASMIMLIGFIAMLALPTILAEETEKKTIDALVMVASYADVVVAKALVGLTYVAIGVPLLLLLTRLWPANLPLFVVSVVLLSVTLVGFGLLLGGLFRNANQVNTWSGLFLLPVVGPAFAVGYPLPDPASAALAIFPTTQAAKLAINGLSGETLFPQPWLAVLIIVAWGVLAYGLLLWRLSRREA